jgi:hypothetical protein
MPSSPKKYVHLQKRVLCNRLWTTGTHCCFLIVNKLQLRLLFTDSLREKAQISSCVGSCGIYVSYTLALGNPPPPPSEKFLFDPVVVSNLGVPAERHWIRQGVAQMFLAG